MVGKSRYLTALKKRCSHVNVASPEDLIESLTRHSEPTEQRIEEPFLCLCHKISVALDLNEYTYSRSSMQDTQPFKLSETVVFASRFDKALCATRERLSAFEWSKEEGKGRGEVSRTVQTRACNASSLVSYNFDSLFISRPSLLFPSINMFCRRAR